jgi:formylglycine-generating enzyme required for sulfatase activity/tetratricopeptide (TPR) repeat protein/tRNA A-37 threonylcarbamoyl transferase component Bud32
MKEDLILARALAINNPGARRAFLDRACADQADVRAKIEQQIARRTPTNTAPPEDPDPANATGPFAAAQEETGPFAEAALEESQEWAILVPGEDEAKALAFLEPSATPGALGRLGHYEVLEVIGRGGMGLVLKARDEKLQRAVALKAMSAALAGDPGARKRFVREARLAAAVTHNHIVAIHAVEEEGPVPYLVMPLIAGHSLQKEIDTRGPLPAAEVARIGLQIAEGLEAAHRHNLIHRDIKPANILLDDDSGSVKITDFGLARAGDDASLTQTGQILGTPMYMSPEQAEGKKVDHRSDLFSFGSVLYALCTGRPPFRAKTTVAVLRRVCDYEPRPVREFNPDIPRWLEKVIFELLQKHPAKRYQTAGEVAAVLREHVTARAVPAKPPPLPTQKAAAAPCTEKVNLHAPQETMIAVPAAPASRRKRLIIGGVLGLVGLLVAALWIVFGGASGPGDNPLVAQDAAGQPEPGKGTRDKLVGSWKGRRKSDREELDLVHTFNNDGGFRSDAFDILGRPRGVTLGRWQFRDGEIQLSFLDGAFENAAVTWIDDDTMTYRIVGQTEQVLVGATTQFHRHGPADNPVVNKDEPKKQPIVKKPLPPYVPVELTEQQAQKLQADWAAKLKRNVQTTTPTGIVMMVVPPGGPAVPQPYLIGKYEVTQGEWEKVMGYNPVKYKVLDPIKYKEQLRLPVEYVSWHSCIQFCNKLSEREKLKPYYEIGQDEVTILGGSGYRLPTDAEWEHACRAGSTKDFHFGDNVAELPNYAWCFLNSPDQIHPGGEKRPNAFGLHDMHGNVWEWSEDRTMRGGDVHYSSNLCKASSRRTEPINNCRGVGVRLARFPAEGEAGTSTPQEEKDAQKRQADWADKLVGSWKGRPSRPKNPFGPDTPPIDVVYTFNKDGNYRLEVFDLNGRSAAIVTGRWEFRDGKIRLVPVTGPTPARLLLVTVALIDNDTMTFRIVETDPPNLAMGEPTTRFLRQTHPGPGGPPPVGGSPKTDLAAAEAQYRSALALYGPKHIVTLGAMNGLGVLYYNARQFDKAIPLFEELLKIYEAQFGRDHRDTKRIVFNLSLNLKEAGQIKKAIPLLEEAHQALKKDPEQAFLFFVTGHLSDAYAKGGEYGKAEKLLVELWNLQKASLGPEHADTLGTMNLLGVVYWRMHQFDKSIPLFRELLTIREKNLGADDAKTITDRANLGINLRDAGQIKEAIALLEKAHEAAKRHPDLAWVTNQLIDAYTKAGEQGKARDLCLEQLAKARKQLPTGSPELAQQLASLGRSLLQAKAFAEAEPPLRESLAIRQKTQPEVWSTFNAQALLGGALLGQNKYQGAEPLLLAGYEGMKKREDKIPPEAKMRLKEAVERLVQLYEKTDRKGEAAKWRKELEAIKSAENKD